MIQPEKILNIDYKTEHDLSQIVPQLPLLTSQHLGWDGIEVHRHYQPAAEMPEHIPNEHIIAIHHPQETLYCERFMDGHRQVEKIKNGLPKYILRRALDYIQAHLSDDLSLKAIAEELNMSQYYFCRLFKQSTGTTPHKYLVQQRVELSKQLLNQRELTIIEISSECGFANPSHFAKCFRKYTGISPKQFRMI